MLGTYHQSPNGPGVTFLSTFQRKPRTHARCLCRPIVDPRSAYTTSLVFSYLNLPSSISNRFLRRRKWLLLKTLVAILSTTPSPSPYKIVFLPSLSPTAEKITKADFPVNRLRIEQKCYWDMGESVQN